MRDCTITDLGQVRCADMNFACFVSRRGRLAVTSIVAQSRLPHNKFAALSVWQGLDAEAVVTSALC
jgi:hypothetical protein